MIIDNDFPLKKLTLDKSNKIFINFRFQFDFYDRVHQGTCILRVQENQQH